MNLKAAYNYLENMKHRSAWNKGVNEYALEILSEYIENYGANAAKPTRKDLLNGAENENQYSYGGCSLIYDSDIAERLCNPTELKKTRNGEKYPNSRETWLDVQARAIYQANSRIIKACRKVEEMEV